MNTVLTEQKKRNQRSRDAWEHYGDHRQQVMRLLAPDETDGSQRLCVLGAGNCNDIDLAQLTKTFAEIHLADLDGEALEFGLTRQSAHGHDQICVHASADVTGIAADLGRWHQEQPPGDSIVRSYVECALKAPVPLLSQPFDVVASICLLTQLIDSASLAIGQGHAGFLELMLALRTRHLRLLVELLRPGGRAVLVTDVVSSVTCPDLPKVSLAALPQAVERLVQQQNFFTGANPFVLRRFFQTDPVVSGLVEDVDLVRPWLWDFGPRVYAVCAVTFARAA